MDVDALAWQTAVITAGGTVSPGRLNNVSNFIIALKAASVWTKIDRFYYLRGQNHFQADVDLVTRNSLTPVGSPVFTANLGYATFRVLTVENYLDTGTVGGTNFTLNSAHVGFYLNINMVNEDGIESGSSDTGTNYICNLSVAWSDGNTYSAINDANTDTGRPRPTDVRGHWVYNRSGSAANQIYQLGSLFASPNKTSTTVPTKNFAIGSAANAAGAFSQGFTQSPNPQFSAWHIGGSLSAGDVSAIKTALDVLIASAAGEDSPFQGMPAALPVRQASPPDFWQTRNTVIRSGPVQAPLSVPLIDPVRFRASPWAAIGSQSSLDWLSTIGPPLPPGQQSYYLRTAPNPWPAIQAQGNLDWITAFSSGPPPGQQSFYLRLQPNPWFAITSQDSVGFDSFALRYIAPVFPVGRQSTFFSFLPNPWVSIGSQFGVSNGELPVLHPPPSFIGSEYVYYALHKGIR